MKRIAFLSLLVLSSASQAGWIVGNQNGINANSATVKGLTSDWGNTGSFGVLTEGGNGPCTNQWVIFSKGSMSPETYRNSFEIAQSALIHGFKVNIHNYNDNSCQNADFIEFGRF